LAEEPNDVGSADREGTMHDPHRILGARAGRSDLWKLGAGFGRLLGFIGALFGGWLERTTGLPELFVVQIGGRPFPVVWSVIGAAVFVAILALLTGRRSSGV
jgi:uncharacterized membrane protein YeaQ/YmgE (transglycosylase-associated protein family)